MEDIGYEKLGKYVPLRGPWEITHDAFGCFPIPSNNKICEFELRK
jgi:hypothetical protein